MTQTIPYREGKHFGTLSIDINDPEDALFLEQFKRIPSRNRDYIAALYAREKRKGINRHVGDHLQPLSLTKQIDSIDMQKTNLNIDKNALRESLKRIEKRTEEINQELQTEQDSNKRAALENERKMLNAEREKIKARADELGIKIAALSAKSSTGGSSPLKPDQLITIIKKLQEQGNKLDLSSVLNKIESIRFDRNGMMYYISALTDMMDKTFIYSNGTPLGLSRVRDGIERLYKVISNTRFTESMTQSKNEIDDALRTVINIQKSIGGDVIARAGIEIDPGVAEALFDRLFTSLLLAIDFDFKDVNFSAINSKYINGNTVDKYIKEINELVDNSTHIHKGFKQKEIPKNELDKYTEISGKIVRYLNETASKITEGGNSTILNICAVLLGISPSNVDKVASYNKVYTKSHEVARQDYENETAAATSIASAISDKRNYNNTKVVTPAVKLVSSSISELTTKLGTIKGATVRYDRKNNLLTINNIEISPVFRYTQPSMQQGNMIVNAVTSEQILDKLMRQHFTKNTQPAESISSNPEYPEPLDKGDTNEEDKEEATLDEEETIMESEKIGTGIFAGYIKIIDRGNPLKRRYR